MSEQQLVPLQAVIDAINLHVPDGVTDGVFVRRRLQAALTELNNSRPDASLHTDAVPVEESIEPFYANTGVEAMQTRDFEPCGMYCGSPCQGQGDGGCMGTMRLEAQDS
jgi:hypothetical protein